MKKVVLADGAVPKKKHKKESSTVLKAGADEVPVMAAAGAAAALPTAASDTTAASAKPEAGGTASAGDAVDWRQRCIERFHLKPLPGEWLVNAATKKYIEALSLSDNACWKRYFEFRTKRDLRADKPEDDSDGA